MTEDGKEGNDTGETKPSAARASRPTADRKKPMKAVSTAKRDHMIIRPMRADAEDSDAAFVQLLNAVRKNTSLTLLKLGDLLGRESLNPEQNISKALNRGKFTAEERQAVLRYIFDDENLLSGQSREKVGAIPDALYFAFLNWVKVKETSQDSARARLIGTYKLWRYSVEHQGEYVYGRIRFWEDPDTRALKVDMLQPKTSKFGVRGSIESGEGYLFRVSHMYLMMIKDKNTRDVRLTIFPRSKVDLIGTDVDPRTGLEREGANPRCQFVGKNLHIVHMDGFALGIDGSSGFFSPVHLSLVDNLDEIAALDQELDVLPPTEEKRIPPRVVEKLKRSGPIQRL